jgi:hypothetical protein
MQQGALPRDGPGRRVGREKKSMFKFATGMVMVAVSLFMLHGPRASVSQPLQLPDTNLWQLAMGTEPGAKSGGQSIPAPPPNQSASPGQSTEPGSEEDAEYRAERCACESLMSDARNHCLEYAKLRYGRW